MFGSFDPVPRDGFDTTIHPSFRTARPDLIERDVWQVVAPLLLLDGRTNREPDNKAPDGRHECLQLEPTYASSIKYQLLG